MTFKTILIDNLRNSWIRSISWFFANSFVGIFKNFHVTMVLASGRFTPGYFVFQACHTFKELESWWCFVTLKISFFWRIRIILRSVKIKIIFQYFFVAFDENYKINFIKWLILLLRFKIKLTFTFKKYHPVACTLRLFTTICIHF